MLVSTKSKQSSLCRRTWRGSNKDSRATRKCCPLWEELLQMVISKFQKNILFFYKASPSQHTRHPTVRVSIQNLTGSYLWVSGKQEKETLQSGHYRYLGAHPLFSHHIRWSLEIFPAWWYLILIPSLMKIISTILNFYFLRFKSHNHQNIFQLSAQLLPTYLLFAVLPHFQSTQDSPHTPQYTGSRKLKTIIKSISCLQQQQRGKRKGATGKKHLLSFITALSFW